MTNRTYQQQHKHHLLKHYSTFTSPYITHHSINDQYGYLVSAVKECIAVSGWNKHMKIRVRGWLQKLDKEGFDDVQKQNRNNYLKLLHLMLETDCFIAPFHALPGSQLPIFKKKEYCDILYQIQRKLVKSKDVSGKSSQWVSPSTSFVRKDLHKQQNFSTIEKKPSRMSILRKKTKTKTPPSTICLGKYKSNMITDDLDEKTVEDIDFKSKQIHFEHNFQQIYLQEPDTEKQIYVNEIEDKFDQIAGMRMSNFISKRLKTFIERSSTKKVKDRSLSKDHIVQNKNSYSKIKYLQPIATTKEEERYWQSNSYNQNNTPKYLHLYPSNPYPSLNLSESDIEKSHFSSRNCECVCNIFRKSSLT